MSLNNKIDILGVNITPISSVELNSKIISHAMKQKTKPLIVFKPYVEFMYAASKDDRIKNILNSADICVADSIALQWSASYLYGDNKRSKSNIIYLMQSLIYKIHNKAWIEQIIPERMQGINQTKPLFSLANKKSIRVAVLGGPQDVETTQKSIAKKYPKIILKVWSGYFDERNEDKIVSEISDFGADILFCALGFPKQEKFIIKNKNKLKANVLIGEGGSFDYEDFGGSIKRAPEILQKFGLEWFWRLVIQPSRIKRQISIPLFINRVYTQKKLKT